VLRQSIQYKNSSIPPSISSTPCSTSEAAVWELPPSRTGVQEVRHRRINAKRWLRRHSQRWQKPLRGAGQLRGALSKLRRCGRRRVECTAEGVIAAVHALATDTGCLTPEKPGRVPFRSQPWCPGRIHFRWRSLRVADLPPPSLSVREVPPKDAGDCPPSERLVAAVFLAVRDRPGLNLPSLATLLAPATSEAVEAAVYTLAQRHAIKAETASGGTAVGLLSDPASGHTAFFADDSHLISYLPTPPPFCSSAIS